MGLETRTRTTFLYIRQGKIVKLVNEGEEGAKSRDTKTGKKIWEKEFDSLSGILKNIEARYNTFIEEKEWQLTLEDGDDKFILKLNRGGGYTKSFMIRIKGCDFSKLIKFEPHWIEGDDGRYRGSMSFWQDDVKIQPVITKDDFPPLEEKTLKGKTVWDDEKRLAFFENMIEKDILPKLQDPATQLKQGAVDHSNDESDDLPF